MRSDIAVFRRWSRAPATQQSDQKIPSKQQLANPAPTFGL